VVRLTREQSQARTRARLLDAAAYVFGEKGFAAASLDEIAQRAGYSRGAVYSNFQDKDDLFLALLEQSSNQMVTDLEEMVASITTIDDLVEGMRRFGRRRSPSDRRRWFLLFNEFRTYALRTPSARKRLAEHERKVRAIYEQLTVDIATHLGVALPVPASRLAAWTHATTNGVEILHELDPEAMPRETAFNGIVYFFRNLTRDSV
jgi:AcrR family transcriptional regulator